MGYAITCLTSRDAADVLATFQLIEPSESDGDKDGEWLKQAQEQYQSWLRESIETGKAIVVFLD